MSTHQFMKLFCLNYQVLHPLLFVGKLSNLYLLNILNLTAQELADKSFLDEDDIKKDAA